MDDQTDILKRVQARLKDPDTVIRKVATDTGMNYDTVLRIRDGEVDPGYSKVKKLADYLFSEAATTRP